MKKLWMTKDKLQNTKNNLISIWNTEREEKNIHLIKCRNKEQGFNNKAFYKLETGSYHGIFEYTILVLLKSMILVLWNGTCMSKGDLL